MANFSSSGGSVSSGKRSSESPAPVSRKETAETAQQRQAAAKLALRKQLEKTLLQVSSTLEILKVQLMLSFVTDTSSQASSTRNAFHPQPSKYRVYLLVWTGGLRVADPQP